MFVEIKCISIKWHSSTLVIKSLGAQHRSLTGTDTSRAQNDLRNTTLLNLLFMCKASLRFVTMGFVVTSLNQRL